MANNPGADPAAVFVDSESAVADAWASAVAAISTLAASDGPTMPAVAPNPTVAASDGPPMDLWKDNWDTSAAEPGRAEQTCGRGMD